MIKLLPHMILIMISFQYITPVLSRYKIWRCLVTGQFLDCAINVDISPFQNGGANFISYDLKFKEFILLIPFDLVHK